MLDNFVLLAKIHRQPSWQKHWNELFIHPDSWKTISSLGYFTQSSTHMETSRRRKGSCRALPILTYWGISVAPFQHCFISTKPRLFPSVGLSSRILETNYQSPPGNRREGKMTEGEKVAVFWIIHSFCPSRSPESSPEDLPMSQKCQVIINDLAQDSWPRAASRFRGACLFWQKQKGKKSRFRVKFYR